jgi:hypothetical protein
LSRSRSGLFGRPSPIIRLRPGSKECEVSKFSAALLLQLMFVCLLARLAQSARCHSGRIVTCSLRLEPIANRCINDGTAVSIIAIGVCNDRVWENYFSARD